MARLGLLSALTVACFGAVATAFPNTPFKVLGRDILDSTGANVTYVGVNWPGAGEVMIPEGLQYQSIGAIVDRIKSLNFNVVRLTFAIEMVDNILDNGLDITLKTAFNNALGEENGEKVLASVLKNNPDFKPETSRLEVFDAVAAELSRQGIWVHLDNHVSKAQWCCSQTDGNAWFGDTYFDVNKWMRGLGYMAEHGNNWNNLVSMGLRNELRRSVDENAENYDWPTWYNNMIPAGETVHAANPDLLIFYSGLNYDTDLSPIPNADDLGKGLRFEKSKFPYADKIVLELHSYDSNVKDCDSLQSKLWNAGFAALDDIGTNQMPVVLTEWGHAQNNADYKSVYASCLRNWIPGLGAGWMVWVLAGSYYIREGTQDFEETWGLLNHEWSNWRSQEAIDNGIALMIKDSLNIKNGTRLLQADPKPPRKPPDDGEAELDVSSLSRLESRYILWTLSLITIHVTRHIFV